MISDQAFPYAHATGTQWQPICDKLIKQLGDIDGNNELAFIYVSDTLSGDVDRIIDYLRATTNIAHWCGSVGIAICSTGIEIYDKSSIAVLVTDLSHNDYRMLPSMRESVTDALAPHKAWCEQTMSSVAIVHGDPTAHTIPTLIEGLSNELQGGFLVGGLTSAEKLQVQIADQAVGDGLSGVLLSGTSVAVTTGLSQGCSLIGEKHEVTECDKNLLGKLDGLPALDVLKKDVGEELANDLQKLGGYIFAALPIAGSDTGDYVVRNMLGIDLDHGSIAIGDYLQVGQSLQFTKRDSDTAKDDMLLMLNKLKQRLPGKVKGALYHTCLGRGKNLFGDNSEELKMIQSVFGDMPVIGFYANGEISHNQLYGYTGILTVFTE